MRSALFPKRLGERERYAARGSSGFRVCALRSLGAWDWRDSRKAGSRTRWLWMRITCDGRMRRFSGRGARRMAAETQRERAEGTIRAFLPADVAAVTTILREVPEAANWTEESYREALNWPGTVALISEEEGKVSGFILGRQEP